MSEEKENEGRRLKTDTREYNEPRVDDPYIEIYSTDLNVDPKIPSSSMAVGSDSENGAEIEAEGSADSDTDSQKAFQIDDSLREEADKCSDDDESTDSKSDLNGRPSVSSDSSKSKTNGLAREISNGSSIYGASGAPASRRSSESRESWLREDKHNDRRSSYNPSSSSNHGESHVQQRKDRKLWGLSLQDGSDHALYLFTNPNGTPVGECLNSASFWTHNGWKWRVKLFPNGAEGAGRHVSVYLEAIEKGARWTRRADFGFSTFYAGKRSPQRGGVKDFNYLNSDWGISDFLKVPKDHLCWSGGLYIQGCVTPVMDKVDALGNEISPSANHVHYRRVSESHISDSYLRWFAKYSIGTTKSIL